MNMITRFNRYLKHRKEFRNEWCTIVIGHVPYRSYMFVAAHQPFWTNTWRVDSQGLGEWTGTPGSVEFSHLLVYLREETQKDVAGFYHTHPPHLGLAQPSQTDIDTMNAWVICLGRPLLCYIDNGWDIACWYFDQYGHFRMRDLGPVNDPLKDGLINTQGNWSERINTQRS